MTRFEVCSIYIAPGGHSKPDTFQLFGEPDVANRFHGEPVSETVINTKQIYLNHFSI